MLHKEYPKGDDVVFESVGGKMLSICVKFINRWMTDHNRCTYKNKSFVNSVAIPTIKLLFNSASVCSFFLPRFAPHYPQHLTKLV